MAAFAKIFSDLVTSDVSTVATWQIGSGSPKVRFGSSADLFTNTSGMSAVGGEAVINSARNRDSKGPESAKSGR